MHAEDEDAFGEEGRDEGVVSVHGNGDEKELQEGEADAADFLQDVFEVCVAMWGCVGVCLTQLGAAALVCSGEGAAFDLQAVFLQLLCTASIETHAIACTTTTSTGADGRLGREQAGASADEEEARQEGWQEEKEQEGGSVRSSRPRRC